MKKLIFTLATLSLVFVGCNTDKEFEQPVENKALKVVVNMDKPSFGDDTRAARTDWEDGDEVICTMGGPGTGIRLTYDADSNSWTTKIFQKSVSGTNYREVDFDEVMASFLENPEDAEGRIMAAYFSSGIHSLAFVEPPTTTMPAMVIATNAARISMGECVMTCENGTYKVEETASEYVLTLDITMKPQVAQYTIRNLNVEDNWYISMGEMSPINMYAGGAITPEGVVLALIEGPIYNAYPHQNGNDISIFAAPWQSNEDIPSDLWETLQPEDQTDDFYCTRTSYAFTVENDENWFERTIGYKAVEIGGAVIMDGPYTSGAEEKWE